MQPSDLPGIDRLVNAAALRPLVDHHGPDRVKRALRALQTEMRNAGDIPDWAGRAEGYAEKVASSLAGQGYQPVHNLTGTVIHTNLGRSPLSGEMWDAIKPLVTGSMNLEYDLSEGRRGNREQVVEDRLARLTGCRGGDGGQ